MALRDLLARFKIDVDRKPLLQADKAIDKTKASTQSLFDALGGLKTAFAALGGALALNEIGQVVNETVRAGVEIDRMSQSLGLSTERLQQWQAVAGNVGVEVDDIRDGFQDLAVRINEAATGTGEGAEVFRLLEIEAKNADGSLRSTEEIMFELADGLANLTDETQRTALADDLLSDAGFRLIPVLKQGSAALKEQLLAAEGVSNVFDKKLIETAKETQVAMLGFRFAVESLRTQVVAFFLPAIRDTIARFTPFVRAVRETIDRTNVLKAAFAALGLGALRAGLAAIAKRFGGLRAAIRALMPVLRPIIAVIARFFLLTLIIDDLITLFQGGESVIGRFIDAIFGVGTAQSVVEDIKRLWQELGPIFSGVAADVLRGVGNMVSALANMFGMLTADSDEALAVFEANFLRASQGVGETIDLLLEAFSLWWTNIKAGWRDMWADIGAGAGELIGSLVGQFTGFADSIGAIFNGIIGGITSRVAAVGKLVSDLKNNTFDTLKSLPSRLANIVTGPSGGQGGKNVTLTDQRTVNVNFQGGGTGPQARRAATEVNALLGRDRRATLAAVSG